MAFKHAGSYKFEFAQLKCAMGSDQLRKINSTSIMTVTLWRSTTCELHNLDWRQRSFQLFATNHTKYLAKNSTKRAIRTSHFKTTSGVHNDTTSM